MNRRPSMWPPMRPPMRLLAATAGLIAASLLSACLLPGDGEVAEPAQSPTPEVTTDIIAEDTPESQSPAELSNAATAALPLPGALPTPVPVVPVPHIYMALQPDGDVPHSS